MTEKAVYLSQKEMFFLVLTQKIHKNGIKEKSKC